MQERCLRLVYNDNISSFNELLSKDGSICFHHRYIHFLAVELFKLKNDLSPRAGDTGGGGGGGTVNCTMGTY